MTQYLVLEKNGEQYAPVGTAERGNPSAAITAVVEDREGQYVAVPMSNWHEMNRRGRIVNTPVEVTPGTLGALIGAPLPDQTDLVEELAAEIEGEPEMENMTDPDAA